MGVSSLHMTNRCGITYRVLDYWTRRGWLELEPNPDGLSGTGIHREWPEREVVIGRNMAGLAAEGLAVARAAAIARHGDPDAVLALLWSQPKAAGDGKA